MGEKFWRRVVIAGCFIAVMFIYWPAIEALRRGDWTMAVIAFVGTTVILAAIAWQSRSDRQM